MWRFLKKIENEPVMIINSESEYFPSGGGDEDDSDHEVTNNSPWILDLHANCDDDGDIDDSMNMNMDIESDDLATGFGHDDLSQSTYETMNSEQTSDVALFLNRAIGAERRQRLIADSFHFAENNYTSITHDHLSQGSTQEETEQFFHDLCAELTNTTAALVSSSSSTASAFNLSPLPEQTLIH